MTYKKKKAPSLPSGETLRKVSLAAFPVLLLLAMTVQTGMMAVALCALCVACALGRRPLENLRSMLSIPLWGLLAFALLCGVSALYASHDREAALELPKLLASLSLAYLVLVRAQRRDIRPLLWGFAAVSSVLSLLCLDAAGSQTLYNAFAALMERWGVPAYASVVEAGWINGRLGGLWNDANLTASILGLSLLVLLHLVLTEERRSLRAVGAVLLGVCAQVFFLSMSRGGILSFAVALLAYLIAVKGGTRLSLFLEMLAAAAVTVAFSLVMVPFLGTESWRPLLLSLTCGAVLALAAEFLCRPLSIRLVGHSKTVSVICGVLAAAALAFAVAAVSVTGPYDLSAEGLLFRAVSLPAGEYTLTTEWEGEAPTVRVYTQSRMEQIAGTNTTLYDGPVADCSFTLKEGTTVRFRYDGAASGGATLREARLSDGTTLKLGYPLLPAFLADRIQDSLLESSSTWLRLQYFRDGLAIFATSPVIGRGLGSFSPLQHAVQPFYYQTEYVHNHLIQIMDETGLLGLAAFLALMGGLFFLLLRRLRREREPLSAVLLAGLVMMNLHGAMELSFSIRACQCVFYLLCALALLQGTAPLPEPAEAQATGEPCSVGAKPCGKSPVPKRASAVSLRARAGWGALCALLIFPAVFGTLYFKSLSAQSLAANINTNDLDSYMSACEELISRDKLNQEGYLLSYTLNASRVTDGRYDTKMVQYAAKLRQNGTYRACFRLAEEYYLYRGEWEELFASLRQAMEDAAGLVENWNEVFNFLRSKALAETTEKTAAFYLEQTLALEDILDTINSCREEEIILNAHNLAFLSMLRDIEAETADSAGVYQRLQALPKLITTVEE